MRLIDADELIKDRVENDPVRIAAECAPTAFDKEKVIEELKANMNSALVISQAVTFMFSNGYYNGIKDAIEIVEKGGIE